MVFLNAMYFIRTSTENIATGYLDKNVDISVLDEIYEYQEKTDIEIKNIGIAYDKSSSTYYVGQPELESANVRSMVIDWSAIEVLEFYSGKTFQRAEVPEKIRQEFLNYNWRTYNSKQLIFEENTLYLCLY